MKANPSFRAERADNPDSHRAATEFRSGWLQGTVVMIEPSRALLFLRAQGTRKKLFIHWAPETQFAIDGRAGSSADLRLGQRLRLRCRFVNKELEADSIAIEPPDSPDTPTPKPTPPPAEHRLHPGRKRP
jgi:hypothetical protein